MDRPQPPARSVRRVATTWLLLLGLSTVLGAVGAQAARGHGCCPQPPVEAQAPEPPCPSLLPLACCEASALPASTPPAPERTDGATGPGLAADVFVAPGRAPAPDACAAHPRVSPLRHSVVLRL